MCNRCGKFDELLKSRGKRSCVSCGAEAPNGASICPSCGAPLPPEPLPPGVSSSASRERTAEGVGGLLADLGEFGSAE
ncbi:MAG: zinc-ribbon domain-containing protein [Coriobacteriales bacterium]